MSKGCIQGSACGPVMWNLILDELLDMVMPRGCHLQAYADDVLLVVTAKDVGELQVNTNNALKDILDWGNGVKLTFGAEKTQAIAFSPKSKEARLVMNDQAIDFTREIKLLGIIIDDKLLFRSHVRRVIEKATRIFNRLCVYSRPTWGAHPENVSTIYTKVIQPIITYAAGIWGHVAQKKYVRKALASVQRNFAIKTIRAFRTVSTNAALAIAQFMPLDLKVSEVHQIEQTRLSGTSCLLPDCIQLERPTPIHNLLHPAQRVSIQYASCSNQEQTLRIHNNTAHSIFTDGSKQNDGATGAAFVVFEPGGAAPVTVKRFKLHDSCTVFQAELLAILYASEWASKHNFPETVILTDSMSSLQAIQNRSSTHPLVAEIHKVISAYLRIGVIRFAWVRSHVGIAGNEAADLAANEATSLQKPPDYAKFPMSHIKLQIRKKNAEAWQDRYTSAEQGSFTRNIFPTLGDINDLWSVTKPTFHLTQFITGHGYHKAYLKRFHITEDDRCPCDGETVQNLDHLLERCPRYGVQRFHHERVCSMFSVPPYEIKILMTKERPFNSYLELTKHIISTLKTFNGT